MAMRTRARPCPRARTPRHEPCCRTARPPRLRARPQQQAAADHGVFSQVADPDRGYALAALTGTLSFKHAKPALIRDLITDRTDPVLFALSYDYVGDVSETVALMWRRVGADRRESWLGHPPPRPSPSRGEGDAANAALPRSKGADK